MNLWGSKNVAVLLLLAAFALAIAGCGGDKKGDGASEETSLANGCQQVEQPDPKDVQLDKPTKKLSADKTYTIVFKTSCGDFTVELDQKNNPKTAASFNHIASEGGYDGTWFHRIIPDFVIQGGDPLGTGTGDVGYRVTEKPDGTYKTGTIAMAKGGDEPAGTSSSQFFVIIGAQGEALPPDYAIAGTVVEGMETVMKIAEFGDPNDATGTGTPTGTALIESATPSAE